TACCGLSTPVETTVAMALAASWKPFMKSNTSASSTSRITTPWPRLTASIQSLRSGILEDDAFEDVGHILAAVGHELKQLVQLLELQHLTHVRFLPEQFGNALAHGAIGIGFELIDFLAQPQDVLRIVHIVEQHDGGAH